MPNSECCAADHDFSGSSGGTSAHQTATMTCRKCGVGHTIEIQHLAPQKIAVDIKMFPAHGSHTITREMIRYFMLCWAATCQDIEKDGNAVVRGTPEIPPAEGL